MGKIHTTDVLKLAEFSWKSAFVPCSFKIYFLENSDPTPSRNIEPLHDPLDNTEYILSYGI